MLHRSFLSIAFLSVLFIPYCVQAQFVQAGDGSYTTVFPGVDVANRNSYPSGTPFLTGNALGKPVPTNDWWSHKVKNNHSANLFNYPYTLKTINSGLITTYIPWGVIGDNEAIIVGVEGLNASEANVSDYSDWTVSMDWQSGTHQFTATSGIGMPFLYFTKGTNDLASVSVQSGTVSVLDEMLVVTDASNGADFAIYAPTGSTWSQNGKVYTSTLNGENYWSMAFLPSSGTTASLAASLKKHAYVFPVNTNTQWAYDEENALVTTQFEVEVDVKEGTDSLMLIGLLPHQWAHLTTNSPEPKSYTYTTVRGALKCLEGNSFSVENTFHGILPTLPYVDNYSKGFNPKKINEKVELLQNESLSTWTDSYNEGQMMNKLIQTARIADLIGNTSARDKLLATVKERLEDWLEANSGEVAFLFYYNANWSAMIGYPAGHGQDGNINDHHFHWGYFIHAAAFMEQYEPGWASKYGDMINLLVRDAASADREDKLFPFLRNFSPYAGHCWANGFASFPQGNDQESTSESMQFNSSLIHWGSITGNDDIRDLGIYLYTTEQTAIEEYWLDIHERNFSTTQQYSLVSRVWGNSYDNGTFWTADIAASYGIEMYPIHGGSFYLGHDTNYVKKLWNEIEQNTGILKNEANANLWHDVYWSYLALIDPQKAIDMYDSYPNRNLKFGISDAQTYHWLHAANALGKVDVSLTADHPLAMAFTQNGETIYVAQNYGSTEIEVSFSNSVSFKVPAHSLVTSKDIDIQGQLSADFYQAYPGGSVNLLLNVSGGTPSKVTFFDGDQQIATLTTTPYMLKATDLNAGKHYISAKIFDGDYFSVSNAVVITVGEQLPFFGNAIAIPGEFDPGNYDFFEGGVGQEVSYNDLNTANEGDYRSNEYVDVLVDPTEGKTVGWIGAGEWLEYTVNVSQPGFYTLAMRYASGNQNGGGPIHITSDGVDIVNDIRLDYTGDWDVWKTKALENIPLKKGTQVLRLFFENGEFNLGKLTFSYDAPLDYSQPIADAGSNILVQLPSSSTNVDGSSSSDPANGNLEYQWTQIYGPSKILFANADQASTQVSGLTEGVYLVKLLVDNGTYTDEDELYIISSQNQNVPPKVSIYSPLGGSQFIENREIVIEAAASDLIGNVSKVEFYANDILVGSTISSPYSSNWYPVKGAYVLKAIAYDDDNASTTSNLVNIIIEEAPPCRGTSYNGDYDYEFSPDEENPTLTFIPNTAGTGSPTCLLYYGSNASALPGYAVTPNVPFKLNAEKGSTIFFYYTYSHPTGGERNTSQNKDSYEIGSCQLPTSQEEPLLEYQVSYYPNPVKDVLHLNLGEGAKKISVYNSTGSQLYSGNIVGATHDVDLSTYSKGIYFVKVENGKRVTSFKVIK